jgi:hypothetical protein
MEKTSRMMQFIWEFIAHKGKWSANVTTKENELTVTLINGTIGKQFRSIDESLLKSQISSFLQLLI